MADSEFKGRLYAEFARIGHAVANPIRIQILDLLSQGERSVEGLAEELRVPLKNASAHLRVLRHARLVETRRDGTRVFYRLGGEEVFLLLRTLESVGRERLAEVENVTRMYLDGRDELQPVTLAELRRLMRDGNVTVIDVRPREEYEAAHIPGALSVPVPELPQHMGSLRRDREVIAYCRGPYCVFSVAAVRLLRRHGFRARRVADGLPDWRAAGLPVASGE